MHGNNLKNTLPKKQGSKSSNFMNWDLKYLVFGPWTAFELQYKIVFYGFINENQYKKIFKLVILSHRLGPTSTKWFFPTGYSNGQTNEAVFLSRSK